eukprot:7166535-Prymnesium_polylepis.1
MLAYPGYVDRGSGKVVPYGSAVRSATIVACTNRLSTHHKPKNTARRTRSGIAFLAYSLNLGSPHRLTLPPRAQTAVE